MAVVIETRTDARIQSDVLAELKWDARVMPNEIGVTVKDGVVTLTGWVDSYTKRWVAEEAAHRVRGVKAVANDIEVRLSSGAGRHDTDIAAAAARALELDAKRITVDVVGSKVTLKGTVRSWAEKQEAERQAWLAPGVTSVDNRITIEL